MSAFLSFLLFFQTLTVSPCPDAVADKLRAWRATREVLRAPGGPAGGAVYRVATEEIGVWLTVHQPRGLDVVSVFRTSGEGTVRLDFGTTCEPEPIPVFEPAEPAANAFTDDELKDRLAADDRLVVYLWSPHLPLSVEGYHEIRDASDGLGVPFVALVDAGAETGFVDRLAEAEGIPAESRRPMASVELLFRDLAVHTPSVIVFANGQVSAPLPGYRSRDAYRAHLEAVLGER